MLPSSDSWKIFSTSIHYRVAYRHGHAPFDTGTANVLIQEHGSQDPASRFTVPITFHQRTDKLLRTRNLKEVHMINKCLFPVAGYGTRFLPATKAMPKEMLPVVNKPLVQYGVEEAVEAGIRYFGCVTGRGKRAIEDHFDISYELEHQIRGTGKEELLKPISDLIDHNEFSYTRQIHMRGLGDAILAGQNLVGDEPFAVVLADDLCVSEPGDDGVLAQMAKLYNQFRCSIVAIQEVPPEETDKYGVIAGECMKEGIYRVTNMVEKPKPEDAPSN